MEWQLEKPTISSGCYESAVVKIWTVTYNEFLTSINNMAEKPYGSVNTRIVNKSWPILGRFYDPSLWIMVLDCDGTDEMLGAKWMLNQDRIGHALVQSSPSRYWIITDYVDTFDKVLTKMTGFPGQDFRHVAFSKEHRLISIRAIALPGKVPIFMGEDGLTDPRVITFYRTLQTHYEHSDVRRRLMAEMVLQNITNKEMLDMAANPEFQL
jgi:hypothetical protein